MLNMGLSVYLLRYPDRSFEGFWANMLMEGIYRPPPPLIYQEGIYCYTVWVRSMGDKCSQLCIDYCSEQIFCWKES